MIAKLAPTLALLFACSAAAAGERAFPAVLAGRAVLPAETFVTPPADAPAFLATSGKFTGPGRQRTEAVGSLPRRANAPAAGPALPFAGQPVQGLSGIKVLADGTLWSLSDNGFGNRRNSPDAALMLHRFRIDWMAGTVERLETLFLSDPDRRVPWPITLEASASRLLTGSDFDPESIQPVGDGFWIGEEFGPFLLKVDRGGRLVELVETRVGDRPVRSPDHPALALPRTPVDTLPAFDIKRSGGFEGLALSPDGRRLYGLLEGPLFIDGAVETVEGRPALRIVEFDLAAGDWTGRSWLYPLSEGSEAIGDFNMIGPDSALVIERDNGQGAAARLKRVYRIALGDVPLGGPVRKVGYVDLLAIADPDRLAGQGGTFAMPFVTIESVDRVDGRHIVVGNDNNLPFSAGRDPDRPDDNEFVLLEVGELLAAE